MLKRVSFNFLMFSLFLGHLPNLFLASFIGRDIPFYLYDIAVLLVFVQSLFLKKYRSKYFDTLLFLFFLSNFILLLLNFKYLLNLSSFFYLFRFVLYLSCYPFLRNIFCNYTFLTPLKCRLLMLIFLSFYLLIFLIYPNVNIASYDPHVKRLYGPFIDPNFYSVLLVLVLIYFLEYKKSAVSFLGIFLTLLSIYLTYSRLGILLTLVVFVIYVVRHRAYYFFPILSGFVLLLFSNLRFLQRFLFIEGNFDSFFFRVLSYIEGIYIFSVNIIPVGFNNIAAYKIFLLSNVNNSSSYTDSFILNLLITGGLLNVVLILFLLMFICFYRIPKFLYLVLFVLLASSFVINTFFHPYFLLVLVTIVGVAVKNPVYYKGGY